MFVYTVVGYCFRTSLIMNAFCILSWFSASSFDLVDLLQMAKVHVTFALLVDGEETRRKSWFLRMNRAKLTCNRHRFHKGDQNSKDAIKVMEHHLVFCLTALLSIWYTFRGNKPLRFRRMCVKRSRGPCKALDLMTWTRASLRKNQWFVWHCTWTIPVAPEMLHHFAWFRLSEIQWIHVSSCIVFHFDPIVNLHT